MSKFASLAQEVQRRLQNTSHDLPKQVDLDTLSTFQDKMKRSGYNREQERHIRESGIKGFFSTIVIWCGDSFFRNPIHNAAMRRK